MLNLQCQTIGRQGLQLDFLIYIIITLAARFVIGAKRESRAKSAGIRTTLIIGDAMLFTYLSAAVDPNSTSRIAAQVISGIGFLGAGMILKGEIDKKITNLTTPASVQYSAAIGMAIGFHFYIITLAAVIFAILMPRVPYITKIKDNRENEG